MYAVNSRRFAEVHLIILSDTFCSVVPCIRTAVAVNNICRFSALPCLKACLCRNFQRSFNIACHIIVHRIWQCRFQCFCQRDQMGRSRSYNYRRRIVHLFCICLGGRITSRTCHIQIKRALHIIFLHCILCLCKRTDCRTEIFQRVCKRKDFRFHCLVFALCMETVASFNDCCHLCHKLRCCCFFYVSCCKLCFISIDQTLNFFWLRQYKSMSVRFRVRHMFRKCMKLFRCIFINIRKWIRPALIHIKSCDIPAIIRNCEDRRFRYFWFLHRVCHRSRKIFRIYICFKLHTFTHHKTSVINVVYRPVEPE